MKRSLALLALAGLVAAGPGCRTAPRQASGPFVAPPQPFVPGGAQAVPPSAFPSAPAAPFPGSPPAAPAPANPFPTASPNVQPAPPPSAPSPGGGGLPPAAPDTRADYRWLPAETRVDLLPPEPMTEQKKETRPAPPAISQGPNPPEISKSTDRTGEKPATALPVGIPQFAGALDNVSAGLRPSLDDGLDWLQAKGYRSVLHVRLPGEADDADRKQVEKRGMKYVSLEVSPQTLHKMTVDEFNRIVRDAKGHPLFVYDQSGALAGGLWYLYFRTAEQLPDDASRIRAGALGLREDQAGGHRDMWQAAQKYLAEVER